MAGKDESLSATHESTTLLSLVPSAFIPTVVFEIGNGAIAPAIALTASELGATTANAAFMLALLGVGRVLGDLPASWLTGGIGDRWSMVVATIIALLAFAVCLVAPSLIILGVALIAIGGANAVFYLARQCYLIEIAPLWLRARAMSSLAGSHRIGLFIGPFVAAAAISVVGLRGAYIVAIAAAAIAGCVLLAVSQVGPSEVQPAMSELDGHLSDRLIVEHRRLFATLGVTILAVGALRASRATVLPLWGDHLDISPEVISLIFGLAGAVDMVLFYPAGKVMDQIGRLAIALPAVLILSISMMLLPLTTGTGSLALIAMIMGFGNGIGTGFIMTLGADVAPIKKRARFLGIWRLITDTGAAGGPVVVSIAAAVSTLAAGAVLIGSIGLLSLVGLAIWVPRYSPYGTPRSTRAQRVDR